MRGFAGVPGITCELAAVPPRQGRVRRLYTAVQTDYLREFQSNRALGSNFKPCKLVPLELSPA